jgi:hypothetical protein
MPAPPGGRRGRCLTEPGRRTTGRKQLQRLATQAHRQLCRTLPRLRRLAAEPGATQESLLARSGPRALDRDVVLYDRGVQLALARQHPGFRHLCTCTGLPRAAFDREARQHLPLRRYRNHTHPWAWLAWWRAHKPEPRVTIRDFGKPAPDLTNAQWLHVRARLVRGMREGAMVVAPA